MTCRVQPVVLPPDEWRKKYNAYIKSAQWKNIRKQLFQMRGNKCERCQMGSPMLAVHHLTYERLGRESPKDLVVLCPDCHELEDEKRAKEGRRRSAAAMESARIDAGFETWCEKRGREPDEREFEAFIEWIDRQECR